MANVTTTVSSPDGPLYVLPGRVPQEVALDATEAFLIKQRDAAEKALATRAQWRVESQRGSERVRSWEEMQES